MRDEHEIRTIARPACFLCGRGGAVLYTDLVDRLFCAPGGWILKVCPGCRLLWLDPTPTLDDLHLAYKNYFTHEAGQSTGRAALLRRLLYRFYQSVSAIPAALVGLHKAKIALRHMFLKNLTPGTLLDVGCGDGAFLNRMLQLGW